MIKKQEAKQYNKFILTSKDLLKDPVSQFDKWFNEAIAENISIPEAMTLSTADHEGKVSSRIVLLKDVIEEDFIFFSNYKSRKGQQLEQNQYASLLFFWPDFERQIRIEGLINKTDSSISDHYFHSRPYESQAAACISPQSEPIAERVELEQKMSEILTNNTPIERPKNWGGYKLTPELFEFWQGRKHRLHDRFQYTRKDGFWEHIRLAP